MLEVYTDGSCLLNPGGALGWSAIFVEQGTVLNTISGGWSHGTNNQAELMAAIQAVLNTPQGTPAVLYSDSQYVVNGVNKWVFGEAVKDYDSVKNPEFWKYLDQLLQGRDIRFEWVRGHAGNRFNEAADKVATREALLHKHFPKLVALGATLPTATTANMQEASAGCEPSSKVVAIELESGLLDDLRAIAQFEGLTLNKLVCRSLEAVLERYEQTAKAAG